MVWQCDRLATTTPVGVTRSPPSRHICCGQPLVTMGCGYLPTGYLPTGYLPIGALPTGGAGGGGSLRGKSAAAATLSMATSAAVTIMTIFMMLIPLCWSPGRADRVTPLFRFVCARRPLLPSHDPAQSPGEWLPTICRFGDGNGSNTIGRIGKDAD